MNIESELPPSLIYHRERKLPESIREIKYLFDFKKILDLIFNILLMVSIGLWLYIVYKSLVTMKNYLDIKDLSKNLDEMEKLLNMFGFISKR